MSQEVNNLTDDVMSKIREGRVKMRPRIYFIAGSVLTFFGVAVSATVAVFLFSVIQFALRPHGPMGSYRLEQLMASFPWWALALALVALGIGIGILRRYEFSYKKNFFLLGVGFVLAVFSAGWVIDRAGLDDVWFTRGPMRGMMRPYLPASDIGGPRGGFRDGGSRIDASINK